MVPAVRPRMEDDRGMNLLHDRAIIVKSSESDPVFQGPRAFRAGVAFNMAGKDQDHRGGALIQSRWLPGGSEYPLERFLVIALAAIAVGADLEPGLLLFVPIALILALGTVIFCSTENVRGAELTAVMLEGLGCGICHTRHDFPGFDFRIIHQSVSAMRGRGAGTAGDAFRVGNGK